MKARIASTLVILTALCAWTFPVLAATGAEDVADLKSQDLFAGGNPDMRYFLIGPKADAVEPAAGFALLVVLPGGDGSADFQSFVKRILKFALGPDYLVAEPVAVKWSAKQEIIWPTAKSNVSGQRFSTEEFVEAVIKDAASKHNIDSKRIFTLSWSSGGPAAYAVSTQPQTAVTGAFVAMSVFHPDSMPPLSNAKGRPFYIYHSPDDAVCRIRFAEAARKALEAAGAKVKFVEYMGGHGWTSGNIYEDIAAGVKWLENSGADTSAALPVTDSFETGNDAPDGWEKSGAVPGVEYIWDRETASDGKASLCLEKTVNSYLPVAGWTRRFNYDGTSPKLTVSAKVKARNVTNAVIDIQFYDAAGSFRHTRAVYIGVENRGDPPVNHDWKEYQGTVTVPKGAKTIVIALQIYGPGKVWFDDFKAAYSK